MLKFNQYLDIVNKAVADIHYPEEPSGLYLPISYTMALGGKRLRPVLVLMACHAFGGDYKQAVTPAVGLELFHNFTLLHDDVMDKADIRRGKPTVHVKWNDNTAILSGDAMLTMATQHIAQAANLKAVMDLFNTTAMEIYEGQQYDVDFENRMDVAVDEYINMIRLKTSVLLGCACKMGAIIAGASQNDCNNIYSYGVYLGLAFQLQDDWLDVFGDEATFGKAIGGDIMNNKKTFLLINAMLNAKGDDKAELNKWLEAENPDRKAKVDAVTAIYSKLGIDYMTQKTIEDYSNKALEALNATSLTGEAKEAFAAFARALMHRNK